MTRMRPSDLRQAALRSACAALIATAVPAMAANPTWEGHAALLGTVQNKAFATGDLAPMVSHGMPAGYSLGAAFCRPLEGALSTRYHLDLLAFRGADGTGLQGARPRHFQAGVDLTLTWDRLIFYAGFQGLLWRQDMAQTTDPMYLNGPGPGGRNRAEGWKAGARVGLEYQVAPLWRLSLGFTQTEFNKFRNPGWMALGVTRTL